MKWLYHESSAKGFLEILKVNKTRPLSFNGYLSGEGQNFQTLCSELFLEMSK